MKKIMLVLVALFVVSVRADAAPNPYGDLAVSWCDHVVERARRSGNFYLMATANLAGDAGEWGGLYSPGWYDVASRLCWTAYELAEKSGDVESQVYMKYSSWYFYALFSAYGGRSEWVFDVETRRRELGLD